MEFPDFLTLFRLFLQDQPPGAPIIVTITEAPKSDLSRLSDVLLGSLGLSGVLALMAITLGIALGGLMFWIKRRASD
jgi:hypothetical protein